MLASLKFKAKTFLTHGHERTVKLKKNIIFSLLIKGTSVLAGFVLIPLTINYVSPGQYGIWLTISSMVVWINTFDIGLSNGLRNKMAHALALEQKELIVRYISTTYAILFVIALSVFAILTFAGSFFNWNELLKTNKSINFNLWPVIVLTLGAFCIQFFLQPINSILIASHQQFKASLVLLLGQLLTLLLTFLLTLFAHSSLLLLVAVVGGSPVIIFLLANIYYFSTSLKSYAPKFSFIDLASAKSLFNTGGLFFLIQIGAIVLFQTDNIVITRNLGPEDVTVFNIAYKYFSLISVIFVILLTPYWSAYTEAYAKQDMVWINQSIRKMKVIWLYISGFAMCLFFFAPIFYHLWIRNAVIIPKSLSLAMVIYVIATNWQGIHATALNGIGKLRIQLILVLSTALINIPLSIFLIHKIGLYGTVVSNIILVCIINIFLTYQVKLIIRNQDKGIWSK
jgi:O-antigen/teichoic acid export membrane protein